MTSDKRIRGGGVDRRDLLKGTAALAGAALLPGTAYAAETAKPRRGGTLRIAMPYNPASIDPMTGRNLTDLNVLYQVFDALIDFDPDTIDLKPGLAKSWKFTDPKTLVLDLESGIEFHDGTPFDAEVVKFNLDRYKNDKRSNVKSDLGSVASVEVTGKSQVTLHLSVANSGLPNILTNRVGLMVSPKSVKDHDGNIDRVAVGTGPFKFVSWEDNVSFVLTRNDKYWRSGLPHLDGISYKIIAELNTAARTVTSGQADLALNMQPQQKAVADRVKGIVAKATPSLVFFGAFFNYAHPPLSDVRIRQALNWGVDRDEIVKVSVLGLGEASSAVLPTGYWATDPETAHYYKYDPDRAKKLLADAGFAGGIEIPTWGWPDQNSMQRQELLMAQLAKAGIKLKLTPVSPGQAMQYMMIEKRGSMLISPCSCYPDPSQLYEALYAKTALRNAGKIELPGFRPLMDATTTAQSIEERKIAFAKLQRFTIEQAMELPQYVSYGVNIMTPKVQNHRLGLLTVPKFAEVWLSA
ncbi:MAG TPA: ABC transporter substrate-binding protein [Hyphomicrobiales bacterium]|nr:ABC transporter substrate-binding protein [Hyphomicrobiales bacterium]